MEEINATIITWKVIVAVLGFAVGVGVAFIYFAHHRISLISISRSGAEIRTNDMSIWSEIRNRIESIDTTTKKLIRKLTTGLTILDPTQYDFSIEVMMVIDKANQPLIFAAYENHHTRELTTGGTDVYITEKTMDVIQSISNFRKHFPKLTDEMVKEYVSRWIKNILIPNQSKACCEKIEYYQSINIRKDVSRAIKEENERCIAKNEIYVKKFKELSEKSVIQNSTTILTYNDYDQATDKSGIRTPYHGTERRKSTISRRVQSQG